MLEFNLNHVSERGHWCYSSDVVIPSHHTYGMPKWDLNRDFLISGNGSQWMSVNRMWFFVPEISDARWFCDIWNSNFVKLATFSLQWILAYMNLIFTKPADVLANLTVSGHEQVQCRKGWVMLFRSFFVVFYCWQNEVIQNGLLYNVRSCGTSKVNSLWPSDFIGPERSGSRLVRVMVCCLTSPIST